MRQSAHFSRRHFPGPFSRYTAGLTATPRRAYPNEPRAGRGAWRTM
ncbi:hypothetical protein ACINK0_17130 [Deinococcus sp. VB343]